MSGERIAERPRCPKCGFRHWGSSPCPFGYGDDSPVSAKPQPTPTVAKIAAEVAADLDDCRGGNEMSDAPRKEG